MLDVLTVEGGSESVVIFEQVRSDWRQGVWLATEGELEVGGV